MAAELGWTTIAMVGAGVLATIGFGMSVARFFGRGPRFAFLTAGSVAICGASAAMAISAILPKDEKSEERLVFTVVGVTVLSTVAMIVYPILADLMGFDAQTTGVFLGATIHDVAQVVGAGFSVSEGTGEVATMVKLLRVSMLAPVILVASLVIRRIRVRDNDAAARPPLVPTFIIAFVALVALNSIGLIPAQVASASADVSRWSLLCAIAGVGLMTSLKDVLEVGVSAIAFLALQTAFIALFVVLSLRFWV